MIRKSGNVILAAAMLLFSVCLSADERLKIVFAGDVMGHLPVISAAEKNGEFDFSDQLAYIKPYIESADIAVANLETTLGGKPYRGYPMFSSPDELGFALKDAGFDLLLLANNHSFDRGGKGLSRTIDILGSIGIDNTGTFRDSADRAERYPLVVEKNGIRVAVINSSYSTNGIEVNPPYIVNMIDEFELLTDLKKAEDLKPDFIVAALHWGDEYSGTESDEQKRIAKLLLDNGADAVIGSHPHVVQPVGLYFDQKTAIVKPVVYSLGNFLSNQRERFRDGGILFELNLVKNETTSLAGFSFMPFWVHKTQADTRTMFSVIPIPYFLAVPERFSFSEKEERQMLEFYSDVKKKLKGIAENTFYDMFTSSKPALQE